MDDETLEDLQRIARDDQQDTNMVDLANMVAGYYAALINKGLPRHVATQLAVAFQSRWISSFALRRRARRSGDPG